MEIAAKKDMDKIARVFEGWHPPLVNSCLQGHMGNAWADNLMAPASAQVIVGDFCCFSGVANMEMVKNIPAGFRSEFILMIPGDAAWGRMIEAAYPNCEKMQRYAIKTPDVFDTAKLNAYIEKVLPEYKLEMINEALFDLSAAEDWSKDLCSQFKTYADYETNGIGVMALHKGMPVSGASSYGVYDAGIEIEVDTKSEYRRNGLAVACAAKLILECLKRNITPGWDAHDMRSVSLAEKLGYTLERPYETYIVPTRR